MLSLEEEIGDRLSWILTDTKGRAITLDEDQVDRITEYILGKVEKRLPTRSSVCNHKPLICNHKPEEVAPKSPAAYLNEYNHATSFKMGYDQAVADIGTNVNVLQKKKQGQRTHCRRGHEFTPENTIINKINTPSYKHPSPTERECRACRLMNRQRYRLKKKAMEHNYLRVPA